MVFIQRGKAVLTMYLFLVLNFIMLTYFYYASITQGLEGIEYKIAGGGSDSIFYYKQALNVYNDLPWIETSIYPFFVGKMMNIFGMPNPYFMRLLNYFGLILLTCSLYRIIKVTSEPIHTNRAIVLFFVLIMLYPSFIVYLNTGVLRDIWIYFFYINSLYYFIKIWFGVKKSTVDIFLVVLNLSCLWMFRKYAVLSILAGTLISYFILNRETEFSNNIFILFLLMVGFSYKFLYNFSIFDMSLSHALSYRHRSLEMYFGSSQMNIRLDQSSFILFLINYLHSFFGNLIGPLPWHIHSRSMFVVFMFETIPMVYILLSIYSNRKKMSRVEIYMIINSIMWTSIIAFTNDNLGTAIRLRIISWLPLLIIFSIRKIEKRKRRSEMKSKSLV